MSNTGKIFVGEGTPLHIVAVIIARLFAQTLLRSASMDSGFSLLA
jgi:hypothetical protein